MSGSVPAWKQAILNRKKQQQKEEELKVAEKEAYLASLPPWKRALFLKKEKGAGDTGASSQQSAPRGTAKLPPKQQQQQSTVTPSAVTQNKPTSAATSSWKQKEFPLSSNISAIKQQHANTLPPVNTNNNNSDTSPRTSPCNTKQFAPSVATSTEATQKETSTALPAAVNGTDNIPLWKRKLLQKQAANTTGDKAPQPVNMKVTETSVAIGSPKVYGKFSNTTSKNPSSTISASTQNTKATDTHTVNTSENRPRVKSVGVYDDYDDDRLASLPPWKRDLILRKRAASAAAAAKEKQTAEVTEPARPVVKVTRKESMEKDSGWRKTIHNSPEHVSNGSGIVRRLPDDKVSMWKKKTAIDQIKPIKRSSQEIDPAKLDSHDAASVQPKTPAAQQKVQPVLTQHTTNNAALVNGSEKEQNDESAPPILRGNNPWAHLSENDPQFKALPLWEQSLILRRRGDIQRRLNPDLNLERDYSSSTNTEDEPDFAKVPAWKREMLLKRPAEKADEEEAMPVFDDPDMPEWKKEKLRKSFQDKKKSHSQSSLPVLVSKKEISSYQSDTSIPEWKKEAIKEKESLKKTNNDIPEWKKEAMKEKQSARKIDNDIPEWKKEKMKQMTVKNDSGILERKEAAKSAKSDNSVFLKSVRPLSPDKLTASSVKQHNPELADERDYHGSNHIDDDDEDDVPCTNIDDLSDSDESAGGSSSYDVNQDSHGMTHQRSSKSILITRKVSNPVST